VKSDRAVRIEFGHWSKSDLTVYCLSFHGQLSNSLNTKSKKLKHARYENICNDLLKDNAQIMLSASLFCSCSSVNNFILSRFYAKYLKILFKTPILGLADNVHDAEDYCKT